MNIETLDKNELIIIALYCGGDKRKKDVTFNEKKIKELGAKLLNEIIEKEFINKDIRVDRT